MVLALTLGSEHAATAQSRPAPPGSGTPTEPSVTTEPGFTIGPEDVLAIHVWREADVSVEVTVRTDGMITMPLIRDVKAAGLTPNDLADHIQTALREFVTDASVTVILKQMNSRKVFITGEVAKPGVYPLRSTVTVMQFIALAGGLTEFADANEITVLRVADGKTTTLKVPYKDIAKGKRVEMNVVLEPGDTVVVPEK
ncbi:polysaccharide biosynthesis/export family protein [Luteitalea pratensis]|nr:polysaccharide biosynthesis/export family protein [Luteitalea pratensis]